MQYFFSADLHLGHFNIIKHCNRPFSSIQEMDKTLLKNINKLVQPKDHFYIVGDFAWWGCNKKQLQDYRAAINCKNVYLIIGNHDEPVLKDLRPLFVKTEHILEIKVSTPENPKQRIIMCHYPMLSWNQKHRKSWNLSGHEHHNRIADPKSMNIDVGVDGEGYNFSPLSLDQVVGIMAKKEWIDPFDQLKKKDKLYRADSRNTPQHD